MKILYLANLRMPTEKAYGYQIAKMCEAFALAGHQITLVAPSRRRLVTENFYDYYDIRKNFVFKVLPALDFYWPGMLDRPAVFLKNFISAFSLSFYAWRADFDMILSRDELPVFLVSFVRRNLVFEAHRYSGSRKIFYRRFKRAGIKVVAISQGLKNAFLDHGFKSGNVLVAHDGVDLDEFNIDLNRAEARRQLGLPEDKIILGYVGQLKTMGMDKGLWILFQAVVILRQEFDSVRLVIVGGSSGDIADYQKLAREVGAGETVLFVGRKARHSIPIFLKAFDILVMPFPRTVHYDRYMSPLKLFEYMASGRPIAAAKLKTISEVLDETCAVLVNPDDPRALAGGAAELIRDPELGRSLAARAIERVKNYTWQNPN